ncbi:Vomeronasal type-2 receptor 26 [Cricetulus griseus]|uniref:Vomeronasal type-2 receptor 26 n=1 Tax=Cricetulus griseus TaxID=10029 RepID=G3IHZ0_CRIGR|nr:Vomeronasal type-2 receptor 26 [Cricetulus griseus]
MLFSWLFISCFPQITIPTPSYRSSECLVRMQYRLNGKGNMAIVGFFPAYTAYPLNKTTDWRMAKFTRDFMVEFKLRNYQCILAMMFAIEEINNNPYLLPNTSLGFEVYNVPHDQRHTLANVFVSFSGTGYGISNYRCASESTPVAVLTGPSWALSEHIGTLLGLYKFPQLTFGPFDSALSERRRFSSLYQVAPKDTSLTVGIGSLMVHFHWNWVGLFIMDDDKGAQILSDLRSELEKIGVCIAFVEMTLVSRGSFLTTSWKNQVQILKSSANVIIIYGDTDSLLSLIVNLKQKLLMWKVWVLNSHWDYSSFDNYLLLDALHGALIFSHHNEKIINFTNFIQTANPSKYPEDTYLHVLWHSFFNCSFLRRDCKIADNCLPNASLEFLPGNIFDMATSEESYNVYSAVYDVAKSLHEMTLQQVQLQTPGKGKDTVFFPWQTPQSVCSESCLPGFRKTHREGEAACCFDCTPCPENEISNETDADQCVKCPETHYANTEKSHCQHKTVTFLAYDDPLGKTLGFISLGFTSLTVAVLWVFLKHRDTPIVKANNRTLSYTLLTTLTLCFLCPLLFIGRPSTVTCILQQNTFGLLFTVALSTVLAKTLTVLIAFRVTTPGRMRRWLLTSRAPNFIVPICTLLQVVLSGVWLATSPPFIDKDAHSEHGHIIIICNKGSAVAFYCILGYLGSLALGSYLMAFLSRNLPDTFNEAKFLAFSMLVFCSVWVSFLPVYHSTKGKIMVAMEVLSILASSTSLLGIIFAPKCYIILLRPERNSLHHIRDKT